jgi:hypothetical protein
MTGALSLFTRRTALGVSIAAIALIARGRAPLAADSTERADPMLSSPRTVSQARLCSTTWQRITSR